MTKPTPPMSIEVADLVRLVPAIRAGARALRERERWASRVAFLAVTAEQARADADELEQLARRIEPGGARP